MKKYFIVLFIFLLFPIASLSNKLMFVTMNYPPYAYESNNKIQGFNIDILNEIFTRMNVKIEYKVVPWARAVKMIQEGDADAIFPFFKTKERELFTDYPNHFTTEPIAMFVLKESKIQYSGNLSQLSQYKFGRVRGYSSGKEFDDAVKNNIVKIDKATHSELNLKKFFKKRFDILVDNKYVILDQLKKQNSLDKIEELSPLLIDSKAYLGFSKKRNHAEIIEKFNFFLKEIKLDGTYEKIINSYFNF